MQELVQAAEQRRGLNPQCPRFDHRIHSHKLSHPLTFRNAFPRIATSSLSTDGRRHGVVLRNFDKRQMTDRIFREEARSNRGLGSALRPVSVAINMIKYVVDAVEKEEGQNTFRDLIGLSADPSTSCGHHARASKSTRQKSRAG
jgi:hypothetical protein